MRFSLLTYNTLFNKATVGLKTIIDQYHPDIICLQEVDTNEENLKQLEKLNYKLADFSNYLIRFGKIFGMATFYNQDKFRFDDSEIIPLPQTLFEWVLPLLKIIQRITLPRNFLKTVFIPKKSEKRLVIYNTHLTVFGSNSTRIKQIKQALKEVDINGKNPLIFAGDFNYLPYGRKNLERLMGKFGFQEATKNINYTIKYSGNLKNLYYSFIPRIITKTFSKLFTDRLKIDYIFYKNLNWRQTKRIEAKYSDHYPILSIFYL